MTSPRTAPASGPRERRSRLLHGLAAVLVAGLSGAALAGVLVASCDGDPVPVLASATADTSGRPAARGTAAAGAVMTPKDCHVTAILAPTCGAWWGMYLPGDPGGTGLDASAAGEQRRLGRPLDLIERYHDMSLTPNGIFPNRAEARLARHHLLLFSWSPADWDTQAVYQWQSVASGALDASVIIPEAKRLRAFRHKVFLTFGAEPDGAVPSLGTPGQYVAAWRHIHTVFAKLGVHNAVWVWTTTGYVPHGATIAALYPGDAYVDWIGYDPYNFFVCHHSPWQTFAETVDPFYQWLAGQHFGRGKPVMLAEFGSAADPGDPGREGDWYQSIVSVLHGLPRIKALVLWNASTPGCDLQLTPGTAAATAYRQAGMSAYVRQDLP